MQIKSHEPILTNEEQTDGLRQHIWPQIWIAKCMQHTSTDPKYMRCEDANRKV